MIKKYKLNNKVYSYLLILGLVLLIIEITFKISGLLGLIITISSFILIIINMALLLKTNKKFKKHVKNIVNNLIFWHVD